MNRRGQAMVEAAGALGILFLLFISIFHIFLMTIDKIRSLDTVYHLARSQQVKNSRNDFMIIQRCFPGGHWLPSHANFVHVTGGPNVQEIVFSFFPLGVQGSLIPCKSVMRIAMPEKDFLTRSWPSASEDPPTGLRRLAQETTVLKGRLLSNHDTEWDAIDDAKATWRAARG